MTLYVSFRYKKCQQKIELLKTLFMLLFFLQRKLCFFGKNQELEKVNIFLFTRCMVKHVRYNTIVYFFHSS